MRPETESELCGMIREAKGALCVQGGATRGTLPSCDAVIETGGMAGISLYEPGALTMVVAAGTKLADIEAALEGEGQRLAFEPMDHRPLLGTSGSPTIGGVVAANVSGPRRIQAGACRDFMLGVRFVDGTGTAIKNGGRVMKNVTGYDLVKLLTGSRGTLGVLSEVSLKVLPKPEFEATLVLHGLDIRAAVRAMSKALGSPFEVTGAAYVPNGSDGAADTMLRLEGFEKSVRYRLKALKDHLPGLSQSSEVEEKASADAWERVRDVSFFADRTGDVWRVSVKPSDAPELVTRIGEDCQTLLDWGGGMIWALTPEGCDLRARLGAFSGHATLVRASDQARGKLAVFHPEPPALAQISAGLRARFDPRGILNPGLMG